MEFYDHVGIQHPSNHWKRCVCVCVCLCVRERCLFNDAVSCKDYVASAIGDLLSVLRCWDHTYREKGN